MANTTTTFFEHLAQRGNEPLLHHVSGSFRFDIAGEGSWYVVTKNGSLSVSREGAGADCVLVCSREDFDRMVVGQQNPTTLLLQGKLQVRGDLGLALLFQRLFPDESLAGSTQGKKEGHDS
ncbi:MAG TPA: SCP2 sterol-binding domain-containing protein [Ktedonobacteraceae bacterium]|nr:SCP2 sterol-binding domain-containing protein [Ktedonobacteraceae bacterium]HZU66398.1 SCP2 sterol-binding domain-containing protein [Ktedonobacteraceae bacterium]